MGFGSISVEFDDEDFEAAEAEGEALDELVERGDLTQEEAARWEEEVVDDLVNKAIKIK